MSQFLNERQERLAEVCARFTFTPLSPLVVCHKVDPELFRPFAAAVARYDQKSGAYDHKNQTPGGILTPKKQIQEEYNLVVTLFFDILKSLRIEGHIAGWNPPTIRRKTDEPNPEHLARMYVSEDAHSDAWIGWDSNSLLLMMPLLGDTERNWVRFYRHPEDADELWVKELPTFRDGAPFVARCTPLPKHYEKGYLYIADMSVIHGTVREDGSSWRVGMETVLHLQKPAPESLGIDTVLTTEEMRLVGDSLKYECLNNMGEIVETTATKRAVNVQLVKR